MAAAAQLLLSSLGALVVLATEALYPTRCIDDLLLAGVERVTFAADVYRERASSRERVVDGATSAGDLGIRIVRVYFCFHNVLESETNKLCR